MKIPASWLIIRHASDAGVYLISDDRALVQSVDFFTPIVDDPRVFGAVSAANALSDLYAMGARPLTALAIVSVPQKGVSFDVLQQILLGGQEKMAEAGAVVIGGHTVQDPEIKFGYAVTGDIHPCQMIGNNGAQPGDALYITKPIGTGVLAIALKKNKLLDDQRQNLHRCLSELNRNASEAMMEIGVSSATDITGFGLLGHAGEMARASSATLEVVADEVPLLPDALALQKKGYRTGGIVENRCYIDDILERRSPIDKDLEELLLDPQTSGGLLIAVPAAKEKALVSSFCTGHVRRWRIGVVREGPPKATTL
jgi:selenide,water dikinase